jgi:hypothetical protein
LSFYSSRKGLTSKESSLIRDEFNFYTHLLHLFRKTAGNEKLFFQPAAIACNYVVPRLSSLAIGDSRQ